MISHTPPPSFGLRDGAPVGVFVGELDGAFEGDELGLDVGCDII